MDRAHIITASIFAIIMVAFGTFYLFQGVALNGSWLISTLAGIGVIATIFHGEDREDTVTAEA